MWHLLGKIKSWSYLGKVCIFLPLDTVAFQISITRSLCNWWWEHIQNWQCTRHTYVHIGCPSKTDYFTRGGYDYTIVMHWMQLHFSCFASINHRIKEFTNSNSSSSESEILNHWISSTDVWLWPLHVHQTTWCIFFSETLRRFIYDEQGPFRVFLWSELNYLM